MRVLMQDTECGHSCLRTGNGITAGDVMQEIFECFLGMGYQKESILRAMEELLEVYTINEKEKNVSRSK